MLEFKLNIQMFAEGDGATAPAPAPTVEGDAVGSPEQPQAIENGARGNLDTITGNLPEPIVKQPGVENAVNQDTLTPNDNEIPDRVSLDSFDDMFDWEDGEKEALMERITQANVTPEQMGIFQELTGEMVEVINEVQANNDKLQEFIKRDYAKEAEALQTAGWTKADVKDVIDYAGGLLGEDGAERLANVVNSADVLFVLKAMKDQIVGDDNALDGKQPPQNQTYTQDQFLTDMQTYNKMVREGKPVAEREAYLTEIKERARRYGDEKLKRDMAQVR